MADVAYNTENICKMIDETVANGAKVIVFPELCVTGYTCSDLFMQDILLKEAKEALFKIADYTKEKDALIFIGVPLAVDGELYNVARVKSWKYSGTYDKDISSELWGIL